MSCNMYSYVSFSVRVKSGTQTRSYWEKKYFSSWGNKPRPKCSVKRRYIGKRETKTDLTVSRVHVTCEYVLCDLFRKSWNAKQVSGSGVTKNKQEPEFFKGLIGETLWLWNRNYMPKSLSGSWPHCRKIFWHGIHKCKNVCILFVYSWY